MDPDQLHQDFEIAFDGVSAVRRGTYAPSTQQYLLKRTIFALEDTPEVTQKLEAMRTQVPAHYMHSLRVGLMFIDLCYHDARVWEKLPKHTLAVVGALHDLGKAEEKVAIAANYPGKLEGEQLAAMRAHNRLSKVRAAYFANKYFPLLCDIAMRHHSYPRHGNERRQNERRTLDLIPDLGERTGKARRNNLRRKSLPEVERAGQYLSIVDMFDALSSIRSYKPAWTEEAIRSAILQNIPGTDAVLDFLVKRYILPQSIQPSSSPDT